MPPAGAAPIRRRSDQDRRACKPNIACLTNESYLETTRERTSTRHENLLLVICATDMAKIISYVSQRNPSMVVWVAQRFGQEQKDALKWLNESQGSKSGPLFFGAEARLARTKDAPPVPVFKLVSSPNGWKKGSGSSDSLRQMLGEVAVQAGILEQDMEDLYQSWFIETCDDWVVPYIGALLGTRTLSRISKTRFGRDPRYRVWMCKPPT